MEGTIDSFRVENGIWLPHASFKNSILYSGYDLQARNLAGDPDSKVNGMYIQYYNGSPSTPTIPLDLDTDYFWNLTGSDGFVRIQTLSNPQYSSTDVANYENNKVTFLGVTDGSNSHGATLTDSLSQFYVLALVSIPDFADPTKDVLFSAAAITKAGVLNPITKAANSQAGFRWGIKFGV